MIAKVIEIPAEDIDENPDLFHFVEYQKATFDVNRQMWLCLVEVVE